MTIRITPSLLRSISDKEQERFIVPLADAMNEFFPIFRIDATKLRVKHFLAQVAHESDGFRTMQEYASGDAYDTRTDLGNTKARDGDGRKYKGRGPLQTTGKTNYLRVQQRMADFGIHVDLENHPELLAEPRYGILAACIFWEDRKLNLLADKDDLRAITKKVNGGYNGLSDRERYFRRIGRFIDATETDPRIGPESSRDLVKLLQAELTKKRYQPGAIDGKWGKLTRTAVLALKADNRMDTGDHTILLSEVKAAPERVIETRQDATVADLRAQGSETVKGADTVQTGTVITGGIGVLGAGAKAAKDSGVLDDAEQVSDTASRWLGILEPFQGLFPFILEWWPVILILGGGGVWYLARRAKLRRLEKYKTGAMG